ncbi:BlaI/MecI/CopY family transcriptional regulator [Asanoa iriomotensis]|nr:BlaI/MecI/CopY family transcriptional regulator [Asanoa iriomotensis]
MRGFGELEAAVMDRLWARAAPTTVREIWTDLSARDLAYNTVLTVVDNLHRKGWLRRERAGRAYRYEPLSSRGEYGARLMRDAMAESGDPASALAGFVRELSPEEAAELLRVLGNRP